MASDIDLRERKARVARTQGKLVKLENCAEELSVSWWRMCADVSLLLFKKLDREDTKRGTQERSPLPSGTGERRGGRARLEAM